jgi:uncharacterized protein (DUF1778 family)
MVLANETKKRSINIRASNSQLHLIDRSVFTLPADEWDAYIATIESPPAPTAALRRLLHESAPWE